MHTQIQSQVCRLLACRSLARVLDHPRSIAAGHRRCAGAWQWEPTHTQVPTRTHMIKVPRVHSFVDETERRFPVSDEGEALCSKFRQLFLISPLTSTVHYNGLEHIRHWHATMYEHEYSCCSICASMCWHDKIIIYTCSYFTPSLSAPFFFSGSFLTTTISIMMPSVLRWLAMLSTDFLA